MKKLTKKHIKLIYLKIRIFSIEWSIPKWLIISIWKNLFLKLINNNNKILV